MKMGPKTVTGNLAEDPVWRAGVNGGDQFLTLRLLETPRVQNRETREWEDGEMVAYDVAVREQRMAQHVASSAHKGDRLTVSGIYQVDPFVTSSGQPGMNHRIYAQEVAASLRFTDVQLPNRKLERSRNPQVENTVKAPEQSQQAPMPAGSPTPATAGGGGFPQPAQAQQPQQSSQGPSGDNQWGRMMAEQFQHQPPATSSAGNQGLSR
ncbi:single-stranded DNA-binding protein [Glutamicibacter ardleyensis]|uniref:single-stranded DNA-binding protein n=1 Tax=Glutamicibacter ardleyensis TaxID=225894 RepID=UPI003FD395A2